MNSQNKENLLDQSNGGENMKEASPVSNFVKDLEGQAFISGLEIINAKVPEHNWLIDGILPLNTICVLSGPSDTGKSILARQIAVAAALGKNEVAGFKLNLTYNSSMYISTEDSVQDWQEKLLKYKLTEEEIKRLTNLTWSSTYNLKLIEKRLATNPVDILIIDVFSDTFEQDINNAIQVRKHFLQYKELAARYGCTVLFIHHVSKKGEAGAPSKANVLGSQGIESSMRCVLELRSDPKEDDCRHLIITKSNYLSPADKKEAYKLKLDSTLRYEYTGDRSLISDLSKTRSGTSPALILRIMALSDQGLSVREVEAKIKEEGYSLCRSRINEIIRQQRAGKTSPGDACPVAI
ncbi:AAA family ATPase [Mucilaginibacter panaciglaebae]|uniref:AAA domain-containing protein n=1 Tax=Mucilaginibacter panaciglaebae TaxID=502331 RepID=A0ABP7WN35_9SPHI